MERRLVFEPAPLAGAWVVAPDPRTDERGFFARAFCQREFAAHGLETGLVQANVSGSRHAGTIRGLHYQVAPAEETKLMRCIRGSVWDVVVDLRPESPTFGQWFGTELSADNRRQLYVPRGFAHGYQTLVDDAEMFYLVSAFHSPEHERGIRWNDPAFAIDWPVRDSLHLSPKDRAWPDFPASFAHTRDAAAPAAKDIR